MRSGGFTFISEIVDIDSDELDLIESLKIRKATKDEIDTFKKQLPLDGLFKINHYEVDWHETDKGKFSGDFIEDAQNWKYHGISFEGTNAIIIKIEKILNLHSSHISTACTVGFSSEDGSIVSYSGISATCENILSGSPPHRLIKIDSDWVAEFRKTWSLYNQLHEEYSFINHAIDSFDSLKRVHEGSDLLVVGYLSIIESLVTHSPRLAESLDSINHQFRNKMILLCKRFSNPIVLESFFPLPKGETNSAKKEDGIWKKLYHYRSSIAHGTKPNFNKELKILRSQQTVTSFLKELAKRLMVYALEEPQFINDLKKC